MRVPRLQLNRRIQVRQPAVWIPQARPGGSATEMRNRVIRREFNRLAGGDDRLVEAVELQLREGQRLGDIRIVALQFETGGQIARRLRMIVRREMRKPPPLQ